MIFNLNSSLLKHDTEKDYKFYAEKKCTQCFTSSYLSLPFNMCFCHAQP